MREALSTRITPKDDENLKGEWNIRLSRERADNVT
jgi:hypothetical protein